MISQEESYLQRLFYFWVQSWGLIPLFSLTLFLPVHCLLLVLCRELLLQIVNRQLQGGSQARVIQLQADYWFINKTKLPIMIKEAGYHETVAGVRPEDDQVRAHSSSSVSPEQITCRLCRDLIVLTLCVRLIF